MRIAAISDIHGNLAALDAVIEDIGRRAVDQIVNLGDLLSGPIQPAETADRLMALNLPTIRGNHERQLLTLAAEEMGASDGHTHPRLADRHLEWIATLPATLWLTENMFLCHGTPDSDLQYFLETVGPTGASEADDTEIRHRIGGIDAALILCGHTHIPRCRRVAGTMIVNPGSVGLPAYADDLPYPHVMETGSPHARYAIVEEGPQRNFTVELVRVPYDYSRAANIAEANGRADWAKALRTGRAS